MKYLKYGLIIIGVVSVLIVGTYFIRGCNETVQEATEGVPFVGKVVDKIEKKIPKVLGGKKQPKSPSGIDPGDKIKLPDPRPSKFMLNPRLDVGIGLGTTLRPEKKDFIPKVGLGASVFSYGKSKMDTKYRFVRIGVQTNMQEVEVTGSPIMIRLGSEKKPLFSNTYLYPYVGYNIQRGSVAAGIGLSISF